MNGGFKEDTSNDGLVDEKLEKNVSMTTQFDDDDLLPLRPGQCEKLPYPPSCPVVHTDFSNQMVTYGVVEKAFLRFETREIEYQLKETTICRDQGGEKPPLIVPESELQFGRGAPVWAAPPNGFDPVAAVVWNAYVAPTTNHNPEFLYSVKTDGGWILHYVSSVQFRADTPTPSVATQVTRDERMSRKHLLHPRDESYQPVQTSGDSDEKLPDEISSDPPEGDHPSPEPNGENCNQVDSVQAQSPTTQTQLPFPRTSNALDRAEDCVESPERGVRSSGLVRYGGNGNHKETWREALSPSKPASEPCLEPGEVSDDEAQLQLHERRPNSLMNYDSSDILDSKGSAQDNDGSTTTTGTETKRQRREEDHILVDNHTIVLPTWMNVNVQTVKDCFYSSQVRLEAETKCKFVLRDGAVETNSSASNNLYIEIGGHGNSSSTAAAIRHLEDLFLTLFEDRGARALFMLDVAQNNPKYYHHQGKYVYQRDSQWLGKRQLPFQWTTFIDLPRVLNCRRGRALLVGSKGRGIGIMQGNMRCRLSVTEHPRCGVLISGDSMDEIDICNRRVWDHIAWAKSEIVHPVRLLV